MDRDLARSLFRRQVAEIHPATRYSRERYLTCFDKKKKSENRTQYRERHRTPTHRYRLLNQPATRRRRIRLRASAHICGRAASRTALVQSPSRSLRSRWEPTVHKPCPHYFCHWPSPVVQPRIDRACSNSCCHTNNSMARDPTFSRHRDLS